MNENKVPNRLVVYRRRMAMTQEFVSRLLGHRNATMLSRYERGRSMPPLQAALQLEVVYRVPVAFLFPVLYEQIRDSIRAAEDRLAVDGQQRLL